MGEIADWILEGGLCQTCGAYLEDGNEPGYPRTCAGCQDNERVEKSDAKIISCIYSRCRKRFNTSAAMKQHCRDKHGDK